MKNKILTSLMAATMIMGSTMPVFAATTENQNVSQVEAPCCHDAEPHQL